MGLGKSIYSHQNKSKPKTLLLLGLSAFLIMPGISHAQSFTSLTKSNVSDFIIQTSKITEGQEQSMDQSQVTAYLDKHLQDEARFKSSVHFHVPGFPPQETSMTLTKQQFIEAAAESAKTVGSYEGNVQILEIKISSNKRSAIVETKSKEEIIVPIEQNGQTQEMPVEGDSICSQTLMLSKSGIIQMFSAQCVTDITFIGDSDLPF